MPNCVLTPNSFDEKEHRLTIETIFNNVLDNYQKSSKKDTGVDGYAVLIEELQKLQDFPFPNASKALKSTILKVIDKHISRLKNFDLSKLPEVAKKAFAARLAAVEALRNKVDSDFQKSNLISEDPKSQGENSVPNIEGIESDTLFDKVWTELDKLLDLVYGLASSLKTLRNTLFELDLSHALIGDVQALVIVKDSQGLNDGIASLKIKYFNTIRDYVRRVDPTTPYGDMYNDQGDLTDNFELLLDRFLEIISKKKVNAEKEFRNEMITGWRLLITNKQGDEVSLYEAVNAYINLRHFDTLLRRSLKNTILIFPDTEGVEVAINFPKYSFSAKLNSYMKTWSTNENRNALDDLGKFSKLLIQSIPRYDMTTKLPIHAVISMTAFVNAFSNLYSSLEFALANNAIGAGVRTLIELANSSHADMNSTMPELLRQLFDNGRSSTSTMESLKRFGLNDYDLTILYSVYKYVFARENSISAIERANFNSSFVWGDFTLVDCVLGVIDRVRGVNYTTTQLDKEGKMAVSIKPKFFNRLAEYNIRNIINRTVIRRTPEDRKTLLDTYNPRYSTEDRSNNSYIVTIGGIDYKIWTRNKLGLLSLGNNVDDILINDGRVNWLRFKDIDLTDAEVVERIILNENLSDEEQRLRDVLLFIQDSLGRSMNILSTAGMNQLLVYLSLDLDGIKSLFAAAIKANIVNSLYYNYSQLGEGSASTFEEYVKSQYTLFLNLTPQLEANYFSLGLGVKDLNAIRISDLWINNWVTARAIISGDISRAVTKDLFNNSIANYSTSFLGAMLQYYVNKTNQAQGDPSSAHLFFSLNPDFVVGTAVNVDFLNSIGDKKNIRKMRNGELLYNAIVHNFWGTRLNLEDGVSNLIKGKWLIQPTTYADKTKIVEYIVDPEKIILINPAASYYGKKLVNLTPDEVADLYLDTVGLFYQQTFANVVKSFATIINSVSPNYLGVDLSKLTLITYGENVTYNLKAANLAAKVIEDWLNEYVNDKAEIADKKAYINSLAGRVGVELMQETSYRTVNGEIHLNELLDYYANFLYASKRNLVEHLEEQKLSFINDLLRNNVNFYVDAALEEKSIIYLAIRALYKGISDSNERNTKIAKYEAEWTRNGKLIIAKVIDKKGQVTNVQYGRPIRLKPGETFALNPLLEEYYYKESYAANNLRLTLTGSEIAHPYSPDVSVSERLSLTQTKKVDKTLLKSYKDRCNTVSCITLGILLKRNVIIPATLLYVLGNAMNGTPSKFKVAIIEDLLAPANNFRGDNVKIKAQDGNAKITPFTSILENMGLQDSAVGVNKKPIWHHYAQNLGSAVLFKFATTTITNEVMLSSINSPLDEHNLFKRMTNLRWHDPTDPTKINTRTFDHPELLASDFNLLQTRGYYNNRRLNFIRDILNNGTLFYQDYGNALSNYYQITGFESVYVEALGKEVYFTEEHKVDPLTASQYSSVPIIRYLLFDDNGESISITKRDLEQLLKQKDEDSLKTIEQLKSAHTIDSLYELHQAMGGMWSVEFDKENRRFNSSERSNYIVANFMNNVQVLREGKSTSDPFTQSTFYQPLKDAQIAYASNSTAIKNGATNVNPRAAWTTNMPLNYFTVDTDGLGMQMDPDHDMSEAEMTEFSQVISSLTAGGRLHDIADLVYQDLGKVALTTAKLELDALEEFLANKSDITKSEIYDIIGRTIINNFKNSREANLASDIIREIEKSGFHFKNNHAKDVFKIPFSDPNVYSQILNTFASVINGKSVKRKYPGSGCVMLPAYGSILTYKFNGSLYKFEDVLRIALRTKFDGKPERGITENYTLYAKRLVNAYLSNLLKKEAYLEPNSFIPSDIVRVTVLNGEKSQQVSLSFSFSIDDYILFSESEETRKYLLKGLKDIDGNPVEINEDTTFKYQLDITRGRDLAPARITWKENGLASNIFLVKEIRQAFTDEIVYTQNGEEKSIVVPKSYTKKGKSFLTYFISSVTSHMPDTGSIQIREGAQDNVAVQAVFDNLDQGFVEKNGKKVAITDLKTEAAELIMSNLYADLFATEQGRTLAQTLEEIKKGPDSNAFLRTFSPVALGLPYDLALIGGDGRNSFITFDEVKTGSSTYSPKVSDWSERLLKRFRHGADNLVYLLDKDNNKELLVGVEKRVAGKVWEDLTDEEKKHYIKGDNDEVYEYLDFITRYKVLLKTPKGYKRTNLYLVNAANVLKAKISAVKTEDLVNLLYMNSGSVELRLSTKFEVSRVDTLEKIILPLAKKLENRDLAYAITSIWDRFVRNAPVKEGQKFIQIPIKDGMSNIVNNYYKRLQKETETSFLRALDMVASRIPALTLQSFMLMQVVAFAKVTKNICYVSHFLTYLQGSDYDIDKAYIMGCSIDSSGKYISWSPLFSFRSLSTLKASELLPTPKNIFILVAKNSLEGVDITDLLLAISTEVEAGHSYTEEELSDIILAQGKLITSLDKTYDRSPKYRTKDVNINEALEYYKGMDIPKEALLVTAKHEVLKEQRPNIWKRAEKEVTESKVAKILRKLKKEVTQDTINNYLAKNRVSVTDAEIGERAVYRLLHPINRHEAYEIPLRIREEAYKNSVQSKIGHIIQDIKNMNAAYSPVVPDNIKAASTLSPKGELTSKMSLTNPATKFLMQAQNMVGKGVIGISATGEKIYFNIYHYWNERIRSGENLQYLKFERTFTRIKGRSEGAAIKTVVDSPANINYDFPDVETFTAEVTNKVQNILDSTVREFRAGVRNGLYTGSATTDNPLFNELFHRRLRDYQNSLNMADLFISEVLTAATDNAKELILDKINATLDLAGTYLYLISLGFNISDIAAFMISPAVSLIAELSDSNLFDSKIPQFKLGDILNILQGKIPWSSFFKGTVYIREETGASRVLSAATIAKRSFNRLKPKLEEGALEMSNEDVFKQYLRDRIEGKETRTFADILDSSLGDNRYVFSDYVENIISKLQDKENLSIDEFFADVQEFYNIHLYASEATTLGTQFLGLNLGLPTTEIDLLTKIRGILSAVYNQEKRYSITYSYKDDQGEVKTISNVYLNPEFLRDFREDYMEDPEDENVVSKFNAIVDTLSENNPKLSKQYIADILRRALLNDIVGNFSAREWLTTDLDSDYHKIVRDYYNIIKSTWNTFDIIDSIPQYRSLIRLLQMEYLYNHNICLKNAIIDKIHDQLLSDNEFLDDPKLTQLLHYVDDRLISTWLDNVVAPEYQYKVKENWSYLGPKAETIKTPIELTLSLKDAGGKASFKYIMENYVIPQLLNGSLTVTNPVDGSELDVQFNPFINGLVYTEDNNGMPFYKLDIDMFTIESSPESSERYYSYLIGLQELLGVTLWGKPLPDWFILYNFIVNKNNYGSERLTTIFKSFINVDSTNTKDNLITSYFKYVGDFDYSSSLEDLLLESFGIKDEDVRMYIAPFKSQSLERGSMEKYIKVSVNGFPVLKRRTADGYVEVKLKNSSLLSVESGERLELIERNKVQYETLAAPTWDMLSFYATLLQSEDPKEVYNALLMLMAKGYLEFKTLECH